MADRAGQRISTPRLIAFIRELAAQGDAGGILLTGNVLHLAADRLEELAQELGKIPTRHATVYNRAQPVEETDNASHEAENEEGEASGR